MPSSIVCHFLLGYDITDKSRLSRVHRYVVANAVPLQYSLFIFIGTASELDDFLSGLSRIIDKNKDDVRCYPINSAAEITCYGRPVMPDGILLSEWEVYSENA